jgi:hypothetical protein
LKPEFVKYGLDLYQGRISMVINRGSSGREKFEFLDDADLDRVMSVIEQENGECCLSVFEKEAVIKRVAVSEDSSFDPQDTIPFEMSVSLLDETGDYFVESYSGGERNTYLAVAYNKKMISQKNASIGNPKKMPGFKLRSLAMSDAFKKYCRHPGGRLLCLLDIGDKTASYCLLDDLKAVMPGSVTSATEADGVSDTFLIDIAATIQYQHAQQSNGSQTLPLSLIIMTGRKASPEKAAQLEKITGIKTVLPEMKKELFSEDSVETASRFLVALGLTVDD